MIMATGNVVFALVDYVDEFKRMNCVREAIYDNTTEDKFTTCLQDAGFFDNGTTWVLAEFILVVVSVVIGSFLEGSMKKKKTS